MPSTIAFEKTADTGTFSRYDPFGDGRTLTVRRGEEMGLQYGFEQSRRTVEVQGRSFPLVRFEAILSPPPLMPGAPLLSPEAARHYHPQFDVLFLPDAEISIRRDPDGFSDEEVEAILEAISLG